MTLSEVPKTSDWRYTVLVAIWPINNYDKVVTNVLTRSIYLPHLKYVRMPFLGPGGVGLSGRFVAGSH